MCRCDQNRQEVFLQIVSDYHDHRSIATFFSKIGTFSQILSQPIPTNCEAPTFPINILMIFVFPCNFVQVKSVMKHLPKHILKQGKEVTEDALRQIRGAV